MKVAHRQPNKSLCVMNTSTSQPIPSTGKKPAFILRAFLFFKRSSEAVLQALGSALKASRLQLLSFSPQSFARVFSWRGAWPAL